MGTVRIEVLPWLTDYFHPRRPGRMVWDEEFGDGGALRDLLRQMEPSHPSFLAAIYDSDAGMLRSHIEVIVNDRLTSMLTILDLCLKDGDHVIFLPSYSGG